MGRNCRICGRKRPNEKFGGKGYAAFVCRDCRQRPKPEQALILAKDEVWGFLQQTNISAKNIARLESLASIQDAAFQELRMLVLEIASVRPRKRKRWKNVWLEYPDLYRRVIAAGWFSNYDLDEQLDNLESPRDVEDPDWDSLDPEERREILAHGRLNASGDSK
ncbi:MAG TPA: hypothetical protein PLR25_23045 [Planctomycetaceae bacterium]|nr:hypothetical protein [Planctomycetaceae bacterium]